MAKTNPIGVRFDEELLNKVKEASLATSPQKALILYEKSYVELIELKVAENNKPENKERIESERKGSGKKATKMAYPGVEGCICEIGRPYNNICCPIHGNGDKGLTISGDAPKTLDELKKLCPFTDPDERRIWVAKERQKYNL